MQWQPLSITHATNPCRLPTDKLLEMPTSPAASSVMVVAKRRQETYYYHRAARRSHLYQRVTAFVSSLMTNTLKIMSVLLNNNAKHDCCIILLSDAFCRNYIVCIEYWIYCKMHNSVSGKSFFFYGTIHPHFVINFTTYTWVYIDCQNYSNRAL